MEPARGCAVLLMKPRERKETGHNRGMAAIAKPADATTVTAVVAMRFAPPSIAVLKIG